MAFLFDTGIFSVIGLDSQIEVGSKLYWYVANTATPTDTFANPELTVPNTNPVLADADGRFPQMWLAPGDYKYVLTAPEGSPADPLATVDGLSVPDSPPSFDPDLDGFLSGSSPLPVNKGGTAATSAANALNNLGAVALAGSTMTGNLIRDGFGGHYYSSNPANTSPRIYVLEDGDPAPSSPPNGSIAIYYAP